MRTFEEYINSNNVEGDLFDHSGETFKKLKNQSGIKRVIEKLAKEEFEVGHTQDPDDFREFRANLSIDGYIATQRDFDYYFECLDEIR